VAVASVLYNSGLLLQADASRREPVGGSFSPGLLGRLLQRRRWLAGTAVAALGWPLHALALSDAPLTVAQPLLGVGLVVPLVFGARMLGESVQRRDVLAVGTLATGVALLVAVAPPQESRVAVSRGLAIALASLGGAVAAALLLTEMLRRHRGLLLMVASGVGFALASMTTKMLANTLRAHAWLAAAGWLSLTAAVGAAALTAEMQALQISAARIVASIVFALETTIPVALSPIVFGETWNVHAWTAGLRVVALALTIGAAITLMRARAVVDALSEG